MAIVAYEVKLDEGGWVKLPAELQAHLGKKVGDTIILQEQDGKLYWLLEPVTLPDLAQAFQQVLVAAGISLDDLLAGLEEDGDAFFREKYGHLISNE
jgi:DNA-binding transcriptional regulator/RsmH inhibitor MraZ